MPCRSSRPRSTETRPADGSAPVLVRRLASIAVAAAGDAVVRFNYVDGYRDLGLRGGSVHFDHDGNPTLHAVRWTRDTTVSGSVHATAYGYAGTLNATGAGRSVAFRVTWGSGRYATAVGAGARLWPPAP